MTSPITMVKYAIWFDNMLYNHKSNLYQYSVD